MEKIGCSNISVSLTLIGFLPLVGGAFGIYEALWNHKYEVSYGTLLSLWMLLVFGLIMCGYRSCFYINHDRFENTKNIFFYKLKTKIYPFNHFNDIYIDIDSHQSSDIHHESKFFYSIQFRGDISNVDITEYIRIKNNVLNKNSWELIKEFSMKLSKITKLTVSYSDIVKSHNSLSSI